MDQYYRNRNCPCTRCRLNDLMGPVMMITLGLLFLIDFSSSRVGFRHLWPVFLIVIGAMKVLQSSASTAGHIQPGYSPTGVIPPVPGTQQSGSGQDGQVRNG
ncbi:MAG: hypothetical protein HYX26_07775 [Acidobacteriales bacterium]|nr:hypothetical protein [Terriglobales bacterium]